MFKYKDMVTNSVLRRTTNKAKHVQSALFSNLTSSFSSVQQQQHRPQSKDRRQIYQRYPSFSTSAENSTQYDPKIFDENNHLRFGTLHELQRNACMAYSGNEVFGTFVPSSNQQDQSEEEGSYEWMTYQNFGEKVANCRAVLRDLGVSEFSKVGIISNNRWEWAAIASAVYSLNGTIVPMYEAQRPYDWLYILNDSECHTLFCANQEIYDTVMKEVLPGAPSVKNVLCLDGNDMEEPYVFQNLMDRVDTEDREASVIAPTPDDLADLIYTSGTTGKPKGVELLHSNICSNVNAVFTMVDRPCDLVSQNDRSLAFLPWAHSYGQTCELWCFMTSGASMGICRGVPMILSDLQMVKPTILFSVPTLYKKVFDGVNNLIETSSPMKQKLMRSALQLGRQKRLNPDSLGLFQRIQDKLLDSIVTSKIRNRFGGNLKLGFCAGAAVPREVIDFMDDIGIPICEGYGLTETSPIITLNVPGKRKVGAVGSPLSGVNVVILGGDDGNTIIEDGREGEICCYGPNVMRGYYNNESATDEVMTLAPDGKSRLFHTGDLGRLAPDGYVHITGRLKEQYKLENGKYVCPTPVEEAIGMSRFISQVILCGANRPYNVALLVLEWDAIRVELGSKDTDEEVLVNDPQVKALINKEIEVCTKNKLKKFEVPQHWAVVAPFTAANNMLTPKMSIRRHVVMKYYEDVIDSLYHGASVVHRAADGNLNHEEEKAA